MNIALWILAALVAVCALAWFGRWVCKRWDNADQALEYRTADWSAIDSDVRKICLGVPDAPPRNRTRAGPLAASHLLQGTQAQVRTQAITAALPDVGKGTSTPNPYRQGSASHTTWAQHYERLISDQKSLQEV